MLRLMLLSLVAVAAGGAEEQGLSRRVLAELAELRASHGQLQQLVAHLESLQGARAAVVALASEGATLPLLLPPVLPPAHGRPPPANNLYVVTTYGADPTGHNDSTAGIQDAFDAATLGMTQGWALKNSRIYEPEIRFPSGHYRITDTINISAVPRRRPPWNGGCGGRGNDTTWCMLAALRVAGEGVASVEQLSNDKDIFAGATTDKLSFTFMNLAGGRHQLHIGNNNTDQGFIKISDCTFAFATGTAIRIIGPSCPDPSCPADPHPHVGSFSSQVIIRDCQFKKNIQALVIWSDWGSITDCWITTSSNMSNLAVIENHDKLMVANILGVPQNRNGSHDATNATRMRWIDNYSHRVDGGTLHVQNMRFGGEAGGITALVNHAPFACQEVLSKLETEMCGRVPRSGPIPTSGMRGAGGSSIIIEGSAISGGGTGPGGGKLFSADVVLEEIPAQLVLRDNWVQTAADDARNGEAASYRLVKVVPEVDLDGPYVAMASQDSLRARPTFEISGTNWNRPSELVGDYGAGTSAAFDLPPQLQPFQVGRVESVAPPTAGAWRAGQVVWNRRAWGSGLGEGVDGAAGWICQTSGTPGVWRALSLLANVTSNQPP